MAEFEKGLSEVTPRTQFEWGNSKDPEWRAEEAHKETIRTGNQELQLSGGNGIKTGSSSSILIDDAPFCNLLDLHGKPQSCQVLNQMLRSQLVLATTICHELVHAVNNAVREPQHVEPFYKDQAINELGFAWEDKVFGGVVSERDSKFRWPFDLSRFPRPSQHAYVWSQEDEKCPERQSHFLRYRAPQSFIRYYVPMKWISRTARQTPWDRWSSSEDPKLLHIPKTIGAHWANEWDPKNSSDEDLPGQMDRRLYREVEEDNESVSTLSDGQVSVQDVKESMSAYRVLGKKPTDGEASPVYVGIQYDSPIHFGGDSPIYVGRDNEEDETDAIDTGSDIGSREQLIIIEDSDSDAMDYEENNRAHIISFTEASHHEEDGTERLWSDTDESDTEEAQWEHPKLFHISAGGYYVDEDGNRSV